MGLFDFLKGAGKEPPKPEPVNKTMEMSAAERQAVNDRRIGMAIANEVERLGFEIQDFSVKVSGETATVHGTVEDQATKEKVVLAVGNTMGIARVDDRIEVVKPEPEAQFHTVVAGESLSVIAKKYYGNAMKYPVIFEANRPMLSDPDKIYPGQVLRIPPLES
jgi:nucleoid-associated protein YgaU